MSCLCGVAEADRWCRLLTHDPPRQPTANAFVVVVVFFFVPSVVVSLDVDLNSTGHRAEVLQRSFSPHFSLAINQTKDDSVRRQNRPAAVFIGAG